MDKNQSKYFYTAQLMDEALIQLLEKKDFDYITVKELCSKAGVNRSTFYLHYDNLNDLLEETITYINNKFNESFKMDFIDKSVIKNKPIDDLMFITPKYLIPYLNFIKDNKKTFMTVQNNSNLFKSSEIFQAMYKEIFEPILDKYNVDKEEQIYVFEYFFRGVLGVIMKWISLGCDDPIDKVIHIIEKCLVKNIK